MNTNDVIDKIKKCFALANSSNQYEAAAALRQAHALMNKYAISDNDIASHDIAESRVNSRVYRQPPNWEANLASVVSRAFRCEAFLLSKSGMRVKGKWTFIGSVTSSKLAAYAFEVLLRQLVKHRSAFITTLSRSMTTYRKTRRADLFCEGWIHAVDAQVGEFAMDAKLQGSIKSYIKKAYGETGSLKVRERNRKGRLSELDAAAIYKGHLAGKEAKLNRGVQGEDTLQLTTIARGI